VTGGDTETWRERAADALRMRDRPRALSPCERTSDLRFQLTPAERAKFDAALALAPIDLEAAFALDRS
jgi:hypothetical protein